MTAYRVRYTPEAAGRIRKLHPQVKQEVREAFRVLLDTPMSGVGAFSPGRIFRVSFLSCTFLPNNLSTE